MFVWRWARRACSIVARDSEDTFGWWTDHRDSSVFNYRREMSDDTGTTERTAERTAERTGRVSSLGGILPPLQISIIMRLLWSDDDEKHNILQEIFITFLIPSYRRIYRNNTYSSLDRGEKRSLIRVEEPAIKRERDNGNYVRFILLLWKFRYAH